MQNQSSSKNTYIALIVIVVIAAGLYFYFKGTPNDSAISSLESVISPSSAEAQAVGNRVLVLLGQINALNIDDTIFKSNAYRSLVDYTITVPEQNVGRPNPFAPIQGSASSQRTSGTPR